MALTVDVQSGPGLRVRDGAHVDEQGSRDSEASFGAAAQCARGRARPWRQRGRRELGHVARCGCAARRRGRGRPRRHVARGSAVWRPQRDQSTRPVAASARPGMDPHRAATYRRHAGAAAHRIPRRAFKRLSLHRVLRCLSGVARAPAGLDATGASRRREDVRRLLGQEAACGRPEHGRGARGWSSSSPCSAPRA